MVYVLYCCGSICYELETLFKMPIDILWNIKVSGFMIYYAWKKIFYPSLEIFCTEMGLINISSSFNSTSWNLICIPKSIGKLQNTDTVKLITEHCIICLYLNWSRVHCEEIKYFLRWFDLYNEKFLSITLLQTTIW